MMFRRLTGEPAQTRKWRPDQLLRLRLEEQVLIAQLPSYRLIYDSEQARVEGMWTSTRHHNYRIRITVPPGYPDECPTSYIVAPHPLRMSNGQTFPDNASHGMHTLGKDSAGNVVVCTMRSEHWSADYSLEKLVLKVQVWLLAYEYHLDTGRELASFLPNDPE